MKKIIAILLALIIAFGWYVSIFGVGKIKPISEDMKLGLDLKGGVYVVMEAQTDKKGEELQKLMNQTQAVIEKRVNSMGLSEPTVTIEGKNRIRVELPGAEDADAAIKAIGRTAQLQFALADNTVVLDGSMVKDAGTSLDKEKGGYAVTLKFNSEGTKAFEEATRKALNGEVVSKVDGVDDKAIMIILDGQIISAPVVNDIISNGEASITGGYTQEKAREDAALIRGGSLPVELEEVTTSVQAASIGIGALQMSIIAGLIGIALIFIFMILMYRVMGIAADIALLLYVLIVLWVMAAMGSVLTLPGIAGIILAIGMAVDANVIIFSRIKEEMVNGKSLRVSVDSGFKRAMATVIDSQITTLIASIVLYQLGTSSVKGFAMTLMLGIVASIITAVVVTRVYLNLMAESKLFGKKILFGIKENNEATFKFKKEFSFIKYRKIFFSISIIVVVVGLLVGGIRGFNLGIDFTGGTMLQLDMGKNVKTAEVQNILKSHDIKAEIVHAGKSNEQIIIRTIQALDNEKRQEVLSDMYKTFDINEKSVLTIDQFGPSIGDLLKKNAVKSVIIASIGMLIYIIIRFEWKFGLASIAGVLHDVLVLIAFYGLFHVPVNNPFIAALLTVVGYSINDTIVVFDRIRENLGLMKKSQLDKLIDRSINQTIVRSLMTSLTTALAIIPLFILGGDVIRQFTLPLIVGVAAGCASSIFICSPLYYVMCQLTSRSKYKGKKVRA
ncbi:protein translocase subunit SecDF [Anaerovorax odorimutans]|uniref:protein translocase subunit SecDF n=1 Tax=Anaerovorax odorimutans TaxID=109327 RepID=UPI000427B429|nr:protein translocase subunit SecDF [Anaerovorax odorimutans]